ncbi:MAG: aspartate/glutamate racemase family protein [Lachnospiraceae bacterium]|nr:aspartate/glutamate racemase family protein [Lachnospiraceae bacterium]
MTGKTRKIGVLDTGVGGLTVVRSLQQVLPGEDILFFGDSANCPYGSRSREENLRLSAPMLDFMEAHDVKCIVIACNTLSVLRDELAEGRRTQVFSTIRSGAGEVIREELRRIGVIGTDFTIGSGLYGELIRAGLPGADVTELADHELAGLIDRGDLFGARANIFGHMEKFRDRGLPPCILLGCTHYPILQDVFEEAAPGTRFLDPAYPLARDVAAWLEQNGLKRNRSAHTLEIWTSGDPAYYVEMCRRLGIQKPSRLGKATLNTKSRRDG